MLYCFIIQVHMTLQQTATNRHTSDVLFFAFYTTTLKHTPLDPVTIFHVIRQYL